MAQAETADAASLRLLVEHLGAENLVKLSGWDTAYVTLWLPVILSQR